MALKHTVAANVKKYRIAQGLTQEKLAIKAKLNPAYIARLERSPQNLTLDVLERLAKVLKRSVGELIGEPNAISLPASISPSELDEVIMILEKNNKGLSLLKTIRNRIV